MLVNCFKLVFDKSLRTITLADATVTVAGCGYFMSVTWPGCLGLRAWCAALDPLQVEERKKKEDCRSHRLQHVFELHWNDISRTYECIDMTVPGAFDLN